jgi:hypothetical protein
MALIRDEVRLFIIATRPKYRLLSGSSSGFKAHAVYCLESASVVGLRADSGLYQFRKAGQLEVVEQLAANGMFDMATVARQLSIPRIRRVLVEHVTLWWVSYVWRVLYYRLEHRLPRVLRLQVSVEPLETGHL